jgi:hypothetical protein
MKVKIKMLYKEYLRHTKNLRTRGVRFCMVCNEDFIVTSGNHKYCSVVCRKINEKNRGLLNG